MEEGMRRTLLRGMSAMNIEAMNLLTAARESDDGRPSFETHGRSPTKSKAFLGSRPDLSSMRWVDALRGGSNGVVVAHAIDLGNIDGESLSHRC